MNEQIIEEELRMLAGAIQPRKSHREETLDRGSNDCHHSRMRRQGAHLMLCMSLLLMCLPMLGVLVQVELPRPPRARAVEAAALEHATETQVRYDWALVEIFKQQSRLNPW